MDVPVELKFKKDPKSYLFSADGGVTPITKTAVTKMYHKIRAHMESRTGEKVQLTSHTERVSLCYWLDVQMKVPQAIAMDWVPALIFKNRPNTTRPSEPPRAEKGRAEVQRRRSSCTTREFGLSRREVGFHRREFGLSRREFGLSRREFGLSRREFGLSRREFGLSRREFGLSRREFGLSFG